MKKRSRTIQTELKIDVKPISDKGMTEEEFRQRIAEIQKQRQQQETIDKMAEARIKPKKPLTLLPVDPHHALYSRVLYLCADYFLLILSLDHLPLWVYWLYLGVSLNESA